MSNLAHISVLCLSLFVCVTTIYRTGGDYLKASVIKPLQVTNHWSQYGRLGDGWKRTALGVESVR